MPIFSYSAKDLQGGSHKGEVETVDESSAAMLLRRKKLIVLSVKPKKEASPGLFDSIFNRISFSDIVIVTRQLATMVEAGLVLSETLDILEEQQANKRLKTVLREVATDVRNGLDFAAALEKHPHVFPNLYSKLVKAGQASGKLDTILKQLATNLEKEREFRNKVRGAMVYPVIVVTMMVAVMLVMVFFVMPKLMGLYSDSGLTLPLPTRIVLGFTNFMLGFWWLVGIMLAGLFVGVKRYIATSQGKFNIDRLMLRVPALGRVISIVIMTNFTRTFGLLVSSGISILDSIKIAAEVTDNAVYKKGLDLVYRGVERGLPFSGQLLGIPIFPKIVGQMARTGEETGKLDEIMFKMADYFESETDNALKNVTTLIEPIVLLLLGIGVAFLVISVILPIYQLTTNIK